MVNKKRNRNSPTISKYLFFLLSILTIESFGQIVFENGYFIDNNDIRTECLVKNYEWKNSPDKIEYRLTQSSKPKIASITEIKEFSVSNYKYRRFTVQIDQSSDALSNLSNTKEPIFVEKTVFLKTIIEGLASLYEAGKPKRYFYNVDTSKVKQLVYKEYLNENRVAENNSYKSQLWKDLKCSSITTKEIGNTGYIKGDLIKVFEKYNTCTESSFINYEKNKKRIALNLIIKPGLKVSSLSIENTQNNSQNIDFGSSTSFCFGIEAQLVLPYNKKKWVVFFEPTYQSYKAEDPRERFSNTVDYKSLELPIGVKYNMFLKQKSKVFISAAIVLLDIPFNSTIGHLEVSSVNNLNLGFGYSFKNKISAEVRYGSPRELLRSYYFYSSTFQSMSFVLGYNFL